MRRISTNMPNNDMQYHLRRREVDMAKVQNQMAKQRRIENLRDDPLAAAHSTRYQSKIFRMDRFQKNIETVRSDYRIAEGYMNESLSIMQRIRELNVQAAHGTYSQDELKYMGTEVNQLLNELVTLGNAKGAEGEALFGGDKSVGDAFRLTQGHVPGSDGKVLTGVDYIGTISRQKAEIGEGAYVEANFPGNSVFWADNQSVYSNVKATDYQVLEDTTIYLDGEGIPLKAGDNIHSIIHKINASDTTVKASLDPVKDSLILETTVPHQIWMDEGEDSQIWQDLGMVSGIGHKPPYNVSEDARVYGGSVLDAVIRLRDLMFTGDQESIGTNAMAGIDAAMDNILTNLSELGAMDERVSTAYARFDTEIPEMQARNSATVDLDVTKAITDLKMLEHTHKAALGAAGRILQPTLLDFLR